MSTITIWYTCKACGITDQKLAVPERLRAVDVVCWMERVVDARIAQDHAERSPHCRNDKMDIMIPVADDATMIGRNSK